MFELRLSASIPLIDDPHHEGTHIQELCGPIVRVTDDDGNEVEEEEVGKLTCYLVSYRAMANDGYLMDAHSSSVGAFCELIDGDAISEDIRDAVFGTCYCGTQLLILDRLEITPKWRGNLLGLKAIHTAIRTFGNGCLVGIKPFPLQFEGSVKGQEKAYAEARDKLRRYYGRLGFKPVPKSEVMLLCTEVKNPNPYEVKLKSKRKRQGSR